jgi:cyclic pyranopterin phosphate synthase
MVEFSHISDSRAEMVDITAKGDVTREATAKGRIYLRKETLVAIQEGTVIKGNVLATARVAATLAVKDTPRMIPMCHQVPIGAIVVEFSEEESWIEATVRVKTVGKTGVEMEALTAAAAAALTIYDMCKAADKGIVIEQVRLIEKTGGKSGAWRRAKKKRQAQL